MHRILTFLAVLIALGLNSSCGSGYGNSGGGNGGGSGISATITDPVTSVQAGATYTFSATSPSNNGYTSGISWSISPVTGAGTLSSATNSGFTSTIVYTAPMTPPSPNSVTITATPSDGAVSAATDMFTVTASGMSSLNGRFAFALSGFDASSEGVSIAGSITADGSGNITGGAMDFNHGHAPATLSASLAGTYTLDSNMRGVISLATAVPGEAGPIALDFTLAADRNSGVVTGSGANGLNVSGILRRQESAAFSLANISSTFVFKLESNSRNRRATVGKLTIGENSDVTGLEDSSEAGTGPLLAAAVMAGRITAPPDANGRSTLMLANSAGASHFALYVVSGESLLLIETVSANASSDRQIGEADRQLPLLSPATANASSILSAAGFDAQPSASGPIGITGNLSIENFTHATLDWTSTSAGASLSEISQRSELVTFDPSNGRATIKIANGFANNFADSIVFYLAAAGDGFVLDTTEGKFNRAIAGSLQPIASSSRLSAVSGTPIR